MFQKYSRVTEPGCASNEGFGFRVCSRSLLLFCQLSIRYCGWVFRGSCGDLGSEACGEKGVSCQAKSEMYVWSSIWEGHGLLCPTSKRATYPVPSGCGSWAPDRRLGPALEYVPCSQRDPWVRSHICQSLPCVDFAFHAG
jgi:hypothetical protein